MTQEDRIRQRAYEIWMREGRPEGRHGEHWHRAAEEIRAEQAAAESPKPRATRARKAAKEAEAASAKPRKRTTKSAAG